MESSPQLRKWLFDTVELVTPRWKLTPSAVWLRTRMRSNVNPVNGPSIHMPTLVCSIQMLLMFELEIAPPIPLTWQESQRSTTSPRIWKLDMLTLELPPSLAQ